MPTEPSVALDTFETHQIELAAYLLCMGRKLVSHRRDGRRVYFKFEGQSPCEALRLEMLGGDPLVPVNSLFGNHTRLKKIIFGEAP